MGRKGVKGDPFIGSRCYYSCSLITLFFSAFYTSSSWLSENRAGKGREGFH